MVSHYGSKGCPRCAFGKYVYIGLGMVRCDRCGHTKVEIR